MARAKKQKSLQVYLDSSDFSVLSDPRRLDAKTAATLDAFEKYADSGLVQFRFSMAHVSEIAPVAPHAQEAAKRRAQLTYRLCGSNALVSVEEIVDAELSSSADFFPYSEGRWYPPIEDLVPQMPLSEMAKLMDAELKAAGLTRAERRQKKRETFKGGEFTKKAQAVLDANYAKATTEILTALPLEPAEVQALMSYVRGGAGRDVVNNAFHRIFANPIWIMERFATAPDSLNGIPAWLRQGASKFLQSMEASLANWHDELHKAREREALWLNVIETTSNPATRKILLEEHASRVQEQRSALARTRVTLTKNIYRRIAERAGSDPVLASLKPDEFQQKCPGIACSISAGLHATNRAMLEVQPRALKASDFGDAMHAFYAPYVDVYRTDAFMADGLATILAKCGTTLAPRLHEMPRLLNQILN
jgi:hypothetical protein